MDLFQVFVALSIEFGKCILIEYGSWVWNLFSNWKLSKVKKTLKDL